MTKKLRLLGNLFNRWLDFSQCREFHRILLIETLFLPLSLEVIKFVLVNFHVRQDHREFRSLVHVVEKTIAVKALDCN